MYSTRCFLDKVIHADGTVTEHAYDAEGKLERTWDANHPSGGQVNPASVVYTHDALNRVTAMSQPWGGAAGGTATAQYGFDVQDHMTRLTDANGTVTSYVYSDRGRMTRETSEVSGVTTYTYNEHGALVSRTDARNVTVGYTLDALDRITFADYPDNALDTAYVWDDPAVFFSKGRLTAITRGGQTVAYSYDCFGRTLQDGGLVYAYDKNGNLQSVVYPGNVKATYTFDFADRHAALSMQDGAGPVQPLVIAAAYESSGPLTGLTLGNGLTESRSFNTRYFPAGVSVPGRLDWSFTTDAVGNVSGVTDHLNAAGSRSSSYQDFQYFLTQANGPWGARSWTYDKLGNRSSETRDGVTDTYTYAPNAAGGLSPRLSLINHGGGGATQLLYDAAGDETFRSASQDKLRLSYGADQRLSELRADSGTTLQGLSQLIYDGRDFLAGSTFSSAAGSTLPEREAAVTYSSSGGLYHRSDLQRRTATSPRNQPQIQSDAYVFYFAARPVALYDKRVTTPPGGSPTSTAALTYLATDHLGTPVLATDAAGATVWQGGFEPFGADWNGAQSAGVFLRFPGQWVDPAWENPKLKSGLHYNLRRWYETGTGRYSQPDPSGPRGDRNLYLYANANPLLWIDPDGLKSRVCCTPIAGGLLKPFKHCFIETQDDQGGSTTRELIGMGNGRRPYGGPLGCTFTNDGFDTDALKHPSTLRCGDWNEDCKTDDCVKQKADEYPRASSYRTLGHNSNSFAGTISRACGLTPPPIAGTWHTPGWHRDPAQPFPGATETTCPERRE